MAPQVSKGGKTQGDPVHVSPVHVVLEDSAAQYLTRGTVSVIKVFDTSRPGSSVDNPGVERSADVSTIRILIKDGTDTQEGSDDTATLESSMVKCPAVPPLISAMTAVEGRSATPSPSAPNPHTSAKIDMVYINTDAVPVSLLVGAPDPKTGFWVDGVIQGVLRESFQQSISRPLRRWLVLDGTLSGPWAGFVEQMLTCQGGVAFLNGERIPLPLGLSIIFETPNLTGVSPVVLSCLSVLTLPLDVLTWHDIFRKWRLVALEELLFLNTIHYDWLASVIGAIWVC